MSCNSCAKRFTLLRVEKGCPCCGFSFCSKCLNDKFFIPKLNSEAKVCARCKKKIELKTNENQTVIPPDAYYKRLAATESKPPGNVHGASTSNIEVKNVDDQIQARLKKLKEDNAAKVASETEIANRLQSIKGVQSTSDADISYRLAKLKGTPIINNKPVLPVNDFRTEQEQADDLMKQYVEQTQIDTKYKDEFDSLLGDIEMRMQKLKEANTPSTVGATTSQTKGIGVKTPNPIVESEDEEESVRKIVEKIKAEASIEENEIAPQTNDELPFCEICNEDATMRCLGCRYLFCKLCFKEHKDDDDGCNRYEPYQPPKGYQY